MSSEKINDTMIEAAHQKLYDTERKFRKACVQITVLNKCLDNMKSRYKKAKSENFNRFRYNLRLKLAVIEGVRNMYYEYACVKAEHVATIRRLLFGEELEIITDDVEETHTG